MPSNSDGLKMLVRREPLTREDWIKLIEARRVLINPHLDSISLPRLGDFGAIPGQRTHVRGLFVGLVNNQVFDIQGHFRLMDSRWIDNVTRCEPMWGLTRSGGWLYAVSIYGRQATHGLRPIDFRAFNQIETKDLISRLEPDIANPEEFVYWELERMIREATEKRRCLYEDLKAVRDIMVAENAALSLIPPK